MYNFKSSGLCQLRICRTLQWRHNGYDGVSNHQPYDRLLNRLFRHRIHRWPVNSPHKGPVTQKRFSFDDVIMKSDIKICQGMQLCSEGVHWFEIVYSSVNKSVNWLSMSALWQLHFSNDSFHFCQNSNHGQKVGYMWWSLYFFVLIYYHMIIKVTVCQNTEN